jgi:outer membrane protein
MRKIIVALVLMIPGLVINAQEENDVWTLQRCLNHAQEHNLTIKLQKLNVDQNEAMLLQQKAGMLPSLSAYANHDYNWGRTVDRFTNDFADSRILSQNFYLSSGVTLFNGFRMLNELKQRQLMLEASKMDVEKTLDDIQIAVVTAYLQVIFSTELVEVTKSQVDITRQQVDQTRKQVDAGALAQGALLNVESQLAQEELNLVNARNQLEIAMLDLKQILELPEQASFNLSIPDISINDNAEINRSAAQVYQYAVENRPSIKSAELRVESSEKGLAAARGAATPNIQLQGSYGTGYSGAARQYTDFNVNGFTPNGNITTAGDTVLSPDINYNDEIIPFQDQIDNNSNYTLGISVSVPIFNGLQRRTNIQTSKISLEQARIQLEQEKNNVRKTIEQAHADARAALKRYYASQKALQAAELSFKYSQQKFNVGMINAVEFNDAKNNMIRAESDLLQSKFEYLFRIKVLDFYLDKPLTIE